MNLSKGLSVDILATRLFMPESLLKSSLLIGKEEETISSKLLASGWGDPSLGPNHPVSSWGM